MSSHEKKRPAVSAIAEAPSRFLRWTTLVGSLSLGCGAGSHTHAHGAVGSASAKEESEVAVDNESHPEIEPSTPGSDAEPKTDTKSGAPADEVEATGGGSDAGPHPDVEAARAALHRLQEADNHLGLAFTVAERASDLPWVLAVENRSNHDVRLATLPSLIEFEVTAPSSSEGEEGKTEKPVVCGNKPPARLATSETSILPAGGMLVHAFDPRTLCEDEAVLKEGVTVRLRFGFPLQTKKLWRKGKLTEVEVEQKAPYVAERVETGGDPVQGLKHLSAAPFALGRTYPLRAVEARPPRESSGSQSEEENPSTNSTADFKPPPSPVEVKIYPLGESKEPERGLVRVQVKNVSNQSLLIHLRREAFRYEVVGPTGSHTCRMTPSELAATRVSYSTISPSSTLSLSTRLAEACPKGVWDEPGTYSVAVRFNPTSEGEEKREGAFTGSVEGANIATLTVPGSVAQRLAHMLIVFD